MFQAWQECAGREAQPMLSKSLAQLPARFEVLKTRPQFTCLGKVSKKKSRVKNVGGLTKPGGGDHPEPNYF